MQVRIYESRKAPSVSGGKVHGWTFDFISFDKKTDTMMGWFSASDTNPNLKIYFETAQKAADFAEKNGWQYEVIDSAKFSIKPKSYSQNFLD